jgi:hypothetical protein
MSVIGFAFKKHHAALRRDAVRVAPEAVGERPVDSLDYGGGRSVELPLQIWIGDGSKIDAQS